MPATTSSIPCQASGNLAFVFSLIGANSFVTFSISLLTKIVPGAGFPVLQFRSVLDAGILFKGTPRIMNTALGVTTMEFDLHNVTAGGITPATQIVDYWVF